MVDPGLLIFDCDGVLIDSEGLAFAALVETLGEYGIEISPQDAMKNYMGYSEADEIADIQSRFHVVLKDDYSKRKRLRCNELFEQHLKAMPGVVDVIDCCLGKKCVASSSSFERLRLSLGLVDLWDRFAPHIFSSEQVKYGKPAPDLFLFAAEQMQVPINDCLVIEDSVAGVKAATAAGMRVYGFSGGHHCPPGHSDRLYQEGAERVFETMNDLADTLTLTLPATR